MMTPLRWLSTRLPTVGPLTMAEVSGSLGDLGILVPLLVGMAHQGSVHFVPALFFAGLWNLISGLTWDVPMCVQPMKTIAAVALADGLTAVQVSLAGMLVAAMVLLLGVTRGVVVVNNFVPVSVVRGLQLGLGLSLARRGLGLIADGELPDYVRRTAPWAGPVLGGVCFVLVLLCRRWPRVPIALLLFLLGIVLAAAHVVVAGRTLEFAPAPPIIWALHNFTSADVSHAFFAAALPQLPLTTLNSVVSVCQLSRDLFPTRPVSQTSVAISVGWMNLIGCALGGMPVCHGAGGLAAQHHFGARRGVSMVFLGSVKIVVALSLGGVTLGLLDTYPDHVIGVLLLFAGLELAKAGAGLKSEDDIIVGLITAATTLTLNTGLGCAVGLVAALCCGGYADIYVRLRDGTLHAHLFRGVSQPLLARYQATDVADDAPSEEEGEMHHTRMQQRQQRAGATRHPTANGEAPPAAVLDHLEAPYPVIEATDDDEGEDTRIGDESTPGSKQLKRDHEASEQV